MNGNLGDDFLKRYEYKVPGGKLLRAKIKIKENKIESLQVTGDFFLLPETDLEKLEKQLIGMRTDQDLIEEKIITFFSEMKTIIAGASSKDFVHVIISALKQS